MKNRSLISKMAISSILAIGVSSLSAAPCASRCRPKCSTSSSKTTAKCGAKCGPKRSAKLDASSIRRPAGYLPSYRLDPKMQSAGEIVFKNTKLSSNGMSCATCHTSGASYQQTFAKPYAHYVEMASSVYGLSQVHLDEAIQMCMEGPMATKPFDWKSADFQNLASFVLSEQAKFIKR